MKKTAKELQAELDLNKHFREHRRESSLLYAPMWVKVVLVWVGTVFGGAVILAVLRLVLK